MFDFVALHVPSCERYLRKLVSVSICVRVGGEWPVSHYHTMLHFDAPKIYSCGKHFEKRRNCLQQAISPFLTMFLSYIPLIFHFKCSLKCRLQFVSNWTSLRFCRLVIGQYYINFHIFTRLLRHNTMIIALEY